MAAELSGLGPQTLRFYEKRGLIAPPRTAGGTRRYSDDDLDRLHRIAELTDSGVNVAGVARILDLETRNTQLESDNTQLESDNTQLRSDNRTLRADNARLAADAHPAHHDDHHNSQQPSSQ